MPLFQILSVFFVERCTSHPTARHYTHLPPKTHVAFLHTRGSLLPALILLCPLILAQTPDAPPQTIVPRDTALNPKLPTVFIVGDSTARNGADLGWGDHFAPLFDTSRVNIANRARAGRSSRTYINEGLWAATLSEVKPGDFVLLQFGHNDGGDLAGAKPRGELKGTGEESQDVPQTAGPLTGSIETIHTFGWYQRKFIRDILARRATPIFLTPTIRNIWKPGADGASQIERDMGYNAYLRDIAAQQHVALADMAAIESVRLQSLGPEKTALLFPIDHTHTSPQGATLNAIDVAESLRRIQSPAAAYLLPKTNQ